MCLKYHMFNAYFLTKATDEVKNPRTQKSISKDSLSNANPSQFLTIDPHFVRKRCRGPGKAEILPQFLTIDPHFVRKGRNKRLSRCRRPPPEERRRTSEGEQKKDKRQKREEEKKRQKKKKTYNVKM